MTTQTNTPGWSAVVQRELDSLQRSVDTRFVDFSSRLNGLLPTNEFLADKRSSHIRFDNIKEKINDCVTDLDNLKREILGEIEKLETAIAKEASDRKKEHKDYIKARQSQFRWLVSMVMIPLTIAIVDLLMSKK